MYRVGSLVLSFLTLHLKAEQAAEKTSRDKPWVSHSDGVVKSANDIYKIFYSKQEKLLVLAGESQPQDPGDLHRLYSMFLDYVQSIDRAARRYSGRLPARAGHRGAQGVRRGKQA